MDFYAYYLYRGYALYAENEDGCFSYDRPSKKWLPFDPEWNLADMDGVEEISFERAANFLS